VSFDLPGAKIATLPEFSEIVEGVGTYTHPDGHVYPPLIHERRMKPGWKRDRKVPQSDRPALMHRMPATHSVAIDQDLSQETARYGLAGFLAHFLGFLFGFRCQFYDWSMDGRVNVKSSVDHTLPTPRQAALVSKSAMDAWNRFAPRQQAVAINCLFLHSRTLTYELEWERFQAEYQVFDAVFALARDTGTIAGVGAVRHRERIKEICKQLTIPFHPTNTDIIIRLRNELIHEALWDGRMPGEARSMESAYASYWLHSLSRRALFRCLKATGDYARSAWWGLGRYRFDLV